MEISALLYSIIDEIGKEKIQSDITSDIELSGYYIKLIFDKCKKHIEGIDEESTGTFCEALLHFMLTVCTLPSARKIEFNNVALDIVIPNLYTLKNSSDKALVIQIAKDAKDDMQAEIKNLARLQPNDQNLWLITKYPLSITRINYAVYPEGKEIPSRERRNYSDIIVDIHNFLEETGDKSLRLFQ
ncbi:MAG: hypothetical protein WBP96_00740 [Nitrososphaeraceae archaeon]